jgi:transcriptional regulator with XRE-family HTH domain|nr:MAG: helix-turn-helix domain protein [Bacteriophage sp.]
MNIQKVIKRQGFTISQVAALVKNQRGGIGVSQGALSSTLNNNPGIEKLQEIANIIGVSLSELVADENDQQGVSLICPHCGKPITLHIDK